jgi:transcription antitermination factor NusG
MLLDAQSLRSDDPCSDRGWWAVYTRHQHERAVADMLLTKDFEVFLPLYKSLRQWKDRNKALTMPLFPGYLFVRERTGVLLQILNTPGTNMVLTCGQHLAVIPNHEIQGIRRALGDPSRVEPYPFLTCGERVRVIRGSLEGVEGILIRKRNLSRLVLSVEMLNRSAAVEIDAIDVVAMPTSDRIPLRIPDASARQTAAV